MRYYQDENKIQYLSVSEIISLSEGHKDWEFIKKQYEDKRHIGSWMAEDQTDLGTVIHKFVDKASKGFIYCPEWLLFIKSYCIVKSEVNLFHKKLFYAGTADIICKNKNKILLCDVKTVVFTDILDYAGEKYKLKIKNKISKTLIQLVAYGLILESIQDNLEIDYKIIIYDPFDKGLVLDYIYTEKEINKAKAKFMKYYDFAVELGYIKSSSYE